ncbi:single-stranded DNA binding protein [Haloferax mediterranei ATCC 33500]|uniref:Replication factor A n=1 Tax=Haloferax mediterranei (strain ATCC 33500 / DSM 1411 / JCM 8866 / NBRC 14739 / NCIMB 2177 / R-4) TaxID=523841 RepID=I3R1W3_HALMT|nr:single-stranded DNA binding protein [Haloferax mediterranei]AFK18223.1 replication factor A [Haloferax mediterranei ATCC 33500]AHZ22376.1 replication factor A [Haloferax mediterranei ATCC 33500]EMA02506.1 replication factor A [Haloferax mediterranei ATCC 33500]MDX5988311.1 single-stranded DNA binding protein [Haloferax mediterranei ATCC 33500]QCQ74746.1 single-stranded DNA binding protein [Haloferax mediterranei ATCC 33500]
MGVIEDVYDDLDTDVEFEKFEAAVKDKVEQMGGLADEETAAMLIAHELRDEEVNGIADIEPGMEDVKFLAKVVSIGELRTFERDDEDEDGQVINIEVADETGRIRVSLWDGMAAGAKENLEVGTVLRVGGRPKEGYNGVEVSASKVEEDIDAEVDVQVLDTYRVEDLALGLSDVNLEGTILDTGTVRTFDRDDGTEGRVSNLSIGDPTGRIRVTLWDERADLVEELETGESVEVVDGYVRERDGSLELHVGSRGAVEVIDEDIEYVPETTDIEALELGQTVDIAGGVIESDGKRTFDRDDGSQGQVRNIRVKDDTGDIRVALWGEKADTDVDLADYVVITDVQIKEGWQDDLEASAGWRSSVTVMDDAPDGTGGSNDADATATSDQGLGAFSDDGSASGSSAGDKSENVASSGASATGTSDESGEPVEFTGTVVQAGNPVILDDGSQTKTVETDADLGLGDEVTVNGTETDDRIDAETVEVHTGAQR